MRCQSCASENPEGLKFCEQCAAPLKRRCARCGFENSPAAKFCGECAAPLGGVPTAVAADRPSVAAEASPAVRIAPEQPTGDAIDGERKTVTALFADIKGSMDLIEDLDPEEARAIVDPALKLMMDAVHRFDGYIVQSTGDGIFALFGAPVAHEDHPQRALYSALRMQDEVERFAEKLRAEKGVNLQVRVGVNTGEVVVRSIKTGEGHVEYSPLGHSTSLASRLQTLAAPGSTAISEAVRKLVEGYFALKALGPARIKGVSEPVNVYEVIGLGPLRRRLQLSAGRGLTKFVGREHEIEAMLAAADRARSGHGQIVAAMAEAGTGKSRLYFEFKAKNQSGWMVLETFSVSHGKASAYLPIIELLHGYFRITSDDDARARREKIGGKVLMLDRAMEDVLPYLFALLGIVAGEDPLAQIDGQVKKRRTLEAIKRILLRESLNQPLMVIFEDLHWIDDETQEFLNLLSDSIANAKILLLVNYRPEYSHQWNSKTYYTQLRLDPLGRQSADEMLSALLGVGAELAPLKRLIIEKTEGNPFFMEETVQVLLDEGALMRNGAVKLAKPLAELKIPPTVQAILASRIDRLAFDAKDLLQTLAVIGRDFPLSLIRAVVPKSDDELNRLLNDLQLGEFIYEQPAVGDVEYTFKHALTQEVAYNSVLMVRRLSLHERTAATIETMYAEHLDDYVGDLAHHYARSSNAAKAITYLHLAGRQAANRSSHGEALKYYRRGFELLSSVGDPGERRRGELALEIGRAVSLRATKGYIAPEVESAYLKAQELSAEVGDDAQLFNVLLALHTLYSVRGELSKARELESQLLAVGERRQQPALVAQAHLALGIRTFYRGEFSAARTHCEQVIASPLSGRRRNTMFAEALGHLAMILWQLGYPDQMTARLHESQAAARESGQPLTLVNVLNYSAMCHLFVSDARTIRELARAGLDLATEHRLPYQLAIMTFFHGCGQVLEGQEQPGFAEIRRGIEALQAISMVPLWMQFALSLSCLRARRLEEGLNVLAEAPRMDSEMHRIKGALLLLRDPLKPDDAERCFRTAIKIARRQEAKSWELRATTSLARLLDKRGKRGEARDALAEVYGWFTEGFDTADLKDAKALLDELSS
jgi:class 3 adenylate cyclase/tetratricopeptide (TPR) repeat protein